MPDSEEPAVPESSSSPRDLPETAPAPATTSTTCRFAHVSPEELQELRDRGRGQYGCRHYRRRVRFIAPCWYVPLKKKLKNFQFHITVASSFNFFPYSITLIPPLSFSPSLLATVMKNGGVGIATTKQNTNKSKTGLKNMSSIEN